MLKIDLRAFFYRKVRKVFSQSKEVILHIDNCIRIRIQNYVYDLLIFAKKPCVILPQSAQSFLAKEKKLYSVSIIANNKIAKLCGLEISLYKTLQTLRKNFASLR